MQVPSPYLDYLIDPNFHGVNRPLMLLFENSVEKKDNNAIIDRKKYFDQPVKNNLVTYDNIWKIYDLMSIQQNFPLLKKLKKRNYSTFFRETVKVL